MTSSAILKLKSALLALVGTIGTILLPLTIAIAQEHPTSSSATELLTAVKSGIKHVADAKKIILDKNQYVEDQLIWDFVNLTSPKMMWLENSLEPWESTHIISPDRVGVTSRTEAWWADYTSRNAGMPAADGLHKWTEEITIGFGWPPYGEPDFNRHLQANPAVASSISRIEEQVRRIAPEIERITGLPVRILEMDDPREQTSGFARLRIVPVSDTGLVNRFKTLTHRPNFQTENYLYQVEHLLLGAVPFTPRSRAGVDGYILPRPDNTIGMSVCKILVTAGEEFVRTLVSECLTRSLGLVDLSLLSDEALVGSWHKAFQSDAKIPLLDGDDAVWPLSIGQEARSKKEKFYTQHVRVDRANASLTEFDEFMLSLLYCQDLAPGMDKYETILAIKTSKYCIKANDVEP